MIGDTNNKACRKPETDQVHVKLKRDQKDKTSRKSDHDARRASGAPKPLFRLTPAVAAVIAAVIMATGALAPVWLKDDPGGASRSQPSLAFPELSVEQLPVAAQSPLPRTRNSSEPIASDSSIARSTGLRFRWIVFYVTLNFLCDDVVPCMLDVCFQAWMENASNQEASWTPTLGDLAGAQHVSLWIGPPNAVPKEEELEAVLGGGVIVAYKAPARILRPWETQVVEGHYQKPIRRNGRELFQISRKVTEYFELSLWLKNSEGVPRSVGFLRGLHTEQYAGNANGGPFMKWVSYGPKDRPAASVVWAPLWNREYDGRVERGRGRPPPLPSSPYSPIDGDVLLAASARPIPRRDRAAGRTARFEASSACTTRPDRISKPQRILIHA